MIIQTFIFITFYFSSFEDKQATVKFGTKKHAFLYFVIRIPNFVTSTIQMTLPFEKRTILTAIEMPFE